VCGLTGFWGAPRAAAELESVARRMTDALARRGPDDSGVHTAERAGLALGHRRLSILDLSAEGHQPMRSADGRFVLAYNGEVYNFAELRRELEAAGERFRGGSDTEVVLAALVRFGVEAALERFVGMFALALWDERERVLVLARDRFGIKPLFWGRHGGTLTFGSELAALRRHPDFRATIDRGALALYFRHNHVPAPHCIYGGVRKVVPGTWLRFREGVREPESHTYWSAFERARRAVEARADGRVGRIDAGEALDGLEERLRSAVGDRLVSDVPLGAFLSGGIDSSLVVALMAEQSARPVRTFTIGFREEGFDEAVHARAVAERLGTEHHELYLGPDEARDVVPSIPEVWDEPFADSSQIPTWLVSRFAREHVTVCLSGDGGDELFGGYRRYFMAARLERKLARLPLPLHRPAAAALGVVPAGAWNGLARALPFLGRYGFTPRWAGHRVGRLCEILATGGRGAFYRSLISHWKEPEALVLGAREPDTPLCDPAIGRALRDPFERMMLLDTLTYLPDDILQKVDRASMAHGLEARVPLLDHRVFEYAWTIPPRLRIGPEPGKRLLRELLARRLPRELFERPKMGFGIPIAQWLRGPLADWGEELLSERRLREAGELDPRPIRERWDELRRGDRDWSHYLWDVLVYQAWRERWCAADAPATPAPLPTSAPAADLAPARAGGAAGTPADGGPRP